MDHGICRLMVTGSMMLPGDGCTDLMAIMSPMLLAGGNIGSTVIG